MPATQRSSGTRPPLLLRLPIPTTVIVMSIPPVPVSVMVMAGCIFPDSNANPYPYCCTTVCGRITEKYSDNSQNEPDVLFHELSPVRQIFTNGQFHQEIP